MRAQSLAVEHQRFGHHHRLTAELAILNTFGRTVCFDSAHVQSRDWYNRGRGEFEFISAYFPDCVFTLRLGIFAASVRQIVEVVSPGSEIRLDQWNRFDRIVDRSLISAAQAQK